MTWQFSFPVFILLLAAILGAILAAAAWRWHGRPGGRALFLLIVAASGWCLLAAMEHATVALPARLIVARFTYLGAASTAPLLLLFILTYTQQMHRLQPRLRPLLWLIPALTIILAFTNELHQWVWTQALSQPHNTSEPLAVVYTHGWWFWLAAAYNCLIMVLSTAALVQSLWQRPNLYHPQAAGLIVATILPWPAYGLYLAGAAPFASLDLTPITFVLSGLVYAWAISMGRLLQLAPIARDLLVENMMEGVLVLDTQHQIIDVNIRFIGLLKKLGLPLTRSELLGRRTEDVFAAWPEIIQRYYDEDEIQDELRLEMGQKLALDLHISPLRDSSGRLIGRLFLVREITERYQLQETLRLQSAALEAAANAVVITDREGAIQWVNPAFTTITGYAKEDVIGQNPRLLKSDKHDPAFYKNLW
ncbi:MAG: PAS domain S-box protein, partial [Anaerolineales bacterium]|nr:PAS domain S-box protein [Anaerolineales bacterium]